MDNILIIIILMLISSFIAGFLLAAFLIMSSYLKEFSRGDRDGRD